MANKKFYIGNLPKGNFVITSCGASSSKNKNRSCVNMYKDKFGDFSLQGNETAEQLQDKIYNCTGCRVNDNVVLYLF